MNTTNPNPTTSQLSPQQISAMLATRRERASREAGNYGLFRQPTGMYSVVARGSGRVYECDGDTCTCPDFQRWGHEIPCKHVYLVRTEEERLEEEARKTRAATVRRNMAEDYPADDYDQPQRRPLVHPLESGLVYVEAWVRHLGDDQGVVPAD